MYPICSVIRELLLHSDNRRYSISCFKRISIFFQSISSFPIYLVCSILIRHSLVCIWNCVDVKNVHRVFFSFAPFHLSCCQIFSICFPIALLRWFLNPFSIAFEIAGSVSFIRVFFTITVHCIDRMSLWHAVLFL